jgi:hypothetical protein
MSDYKELLILNRMFSPYLYSNIIEVIDMLYFISNYHKLINYYF